MEHQHDLYFLNNNLSESTWFFSRDVVNAFEGVGMKAARALRSFMLITSESEIERDCTIEATIMGLRLKVERRGFDIYVDLL